MTYGGAPYGGAPYGGGLSNHQYTQSLASSLSFVGASNRSTARGMPGGLSFIGILRKATALPVSGGNLGFTASHMHVVSLLLVGTLPFVGSQRKQSTVLLATDALSFAGSQSKQTPVVLIADVQLGGVLATLFIEHVTVVTLLPPRSHNVQVRISLKDSARGAGKRYATGKFWKDSARGAGKRYSRVRGKLQ